MQISFIVRATPMAKVRFGEDYGKTVTVCSFPMIRPRVQAALDFLLGIIKSECVEEKEIYEL